MNPIGALIIYILWWWIVFFAVLPQGIKSRWEVEDDGVRGADPGAPAEFPVKQKLIRTSVIAGVLWAVTIGIILSGLLDFRD